MPAFPNGSFEKKLYSLYLSYLPKDKVAFDLKMNCDDRSQFSVNISKPGITKGQHWHNTKWEFSIVVAGHGLIQERRIGTDPATRKPYEPIEFKVSGDHIQAVHMLPGYTYNMMEESQGKKILNKEVLRKYGEKVELFPGVEEWFERIREYGRSKGIIVEHYIISSGLREMIEGTKPAQQGAFEKIYASSFYYDKNGVAKWPAQVINYTGKTQFLFRIEKGVLNINDQGVNDYFPVDMRRVPFRNMIYIGDSDTDIPCMKVVSSFGGHSIGVYSSVTKDKTKVYQMIRDNRINYFAPADYSEGMELDSLVKKIIDKTATNELLEEEHYKYKKEVRDADRTIGEEQRRKYHLINSLEDSNGSISSDAVIYEMEKINTWTDKEIERICSIAWKNIQVELVLGESHIADFFKHIIDQYYRRNHRYGKYTNLVKDLLEDTDT